MDSVAKYVYCWDDLNPCESGDGCIIGGTLVQGGLLPWKAVLGEATGSDIRLVCVDSTPTS